MLRNGSWVSSTSSPSSSMILFSSSSVLAIGGWTGVGGFNGMHPRAILVASTAVVLSFESLERSAAISWRSEIKMRTAQLS